MLVRQKMSYKENLENQFKGKIVDIEEVRNESDKENPEETLVNLIVEFEDGTKRKIRRAKKLDKQNSSGT